MDGSFSGVRNYAGGRALDSFSQKRAENIKKSRTNPPGSSRSPLSTVDQNSPLAFVMGTTTKGCNLTPLSTWHFNGNHGHGFNSQITSTGFDRTPVHSIGPNNAPGHVLETQERENIYMKIPQ
ncbi:uncharacterized protein LOC108198363 [Daucus carota subsp. sativus]|uniref:uncharacterized protein LOC108198363 n=1 Tax=Daucus carota subsp. sativus TaxID=79200 RepID=UPI0007F00C9B|nr:PREDICTED: uncharacterized protein LOC108198363 [Daucus carota subsp. sativus]